MKNWSQKIGSIRTLIIVDTIDLGSVVKGRSLRDGWVIISGSESKNRYGLRPVAALRFPVGPDRSGAAIYRAYFRCLSAVPLYSAVPCCRITHEDAGSYRKSPGEKRCVLRRCPYRNSR